MTNATAEDSYFSVSLAPICFGLLSDKAKERNSSLNKLKSILPVLIKGEEFSSISAEKVVKSFLDWLQAEIRISRKNNNNIQIKNNVQINNNANFTCINTALRELKWLISLLDANFPRINLSGIVLELIDRLSDVMAINENYQISMGPEIPYILNYQILNKAPYLKLLKESKLTSRFHKLLSVICKQISFNDSPELLVKCLTYLAIYIPNQLKLEPITYELFHKSFLEYLNFISSSSSKCESVHPALLSAINSLLSDSFEHSLKFFPEYLKFIFPFLKSKNQILFQKSLQFFYLNFKLIPKKFHQKLLQFICDELAEPLHCFLLSYNPVDFCKQIQNFEKNFAINNSWSIISTFLGICKHFEIPNELINIPLYLFKVLTSSKHDQLIFPVLLNNDPKIKNFLDWTALLNFHCNHKKDSDTVNYHSNNNSNHSNNSINIPNINSGNIKFESANSSVNWYKLWFICTHSYLFPNLKIFDLDEFVIKTLKTETINPANSSSFDSSIALDSFCAYFNFRFKNNLLWTKSAEEVFQSFLNCLIVLFKHQSLKIWTRFTEISWFNSLLKALIVPSIFISNKSNTPHERYIDDLKALDSELLIKRFNRINKYTNSINGIFESEEYIDSDPESLNQISKSHPYYKSLKEFYTKLSGIFSFAAADNFSGESSEYNLSSKKSLLDCTINLNLNILEFFVNLQDPEASNENFEFIKLLGTMKFQGQKYNLLLDSFEAFGPLVSKRIEITTLLSILIPSLQQAQSHHYLDPENNNDIDEDFKSTSKKVGFEVNITCAEIFKSSITNSFVQSFIFQLSKLFLNQYVSAKLAASEQLQILDDWKLFMDEIEISNESTSNNNTHNNKFIWTTQSLATILREARPFFDFPTNFSTLKIALFSDSNSVDVSNALPSPHTIIKKLSTPEQWLPFLFLIFNSPSVSNDLVLDWLLCLTNEPIFHEYTFFCKFMRLNLSPSFSNAFLKKWIESGRLITNFPFIFLSECECENENECYFTFNNKKLKFILESPHFPLILSQFPSFEALLCTQIGNRNSKTILETIKNYLPHLMASCLLVESLSKSTKEAPYVVDFSFLKTSSVDFTSISFVSLTVALLSHGQYYPWSVLVSALQSLAKMFKLSAATDFSEIFNPIHSIFIFCSLIPLIHDISFLKTIFTQVPILTHHPRLVLLVLKLLREQKENGNLKLQEIFSFYNFAEKYLNAPIFKRELFSLSLLKSKFESSIVIFNYPNDLFSSDSGGLENFKDILINCKIKDLKLLVPFSLISSCSEVDKEILAEILEKRKSELNCSSSLIFIKEHLHFSTKHKIQNTPTESLISSVLSYSHSKLFSEHFSYALCELLYRILNLTNNLNGSRKFPLDALIELDISVKEDLKLFVLPLGSKVLAFSSSISLSESNKLTLKKKEFINESKEYWTDFNEEILLRDLCSFLFLYHDQSLSFIVDIFDHHNPNNANCNHYLGSYYNYQDFFWIILPHLLNSLNSNSASFSIIPKIIQKLIEGLEIQPIKCVALKILNLIIEKSSIGPNFVDNLLRRFSFNAKVFELLQTSSSSGISSLYFNSIIRESPKLSNCELNLKSLSYFFEKIGSEGDEEGFEYLSVVKKRLSKFDHIEACWPEIQSKENFNLKSNDNNTWINRCWFDQRDFKPPNGLEILNFKSQSKNLNKLFNIFNGNFIDETLNSNLNSEEAKVLRIIENCMKNKKCPNVREILSLSYNPTKFNYQVISLLALISPKMEQLSRHLLADMCSKVYWQQGNFEQALETAKGALLMFPSSLPDESKALLLSRIGEWASASKSERPSHILSQYFEKAMALCENVNNSSAFSTASLAQIHIKVARFVDDQYQQIKESEDFKSRAKLLEESRTALSAARSSSSSSLSAQDRRQLEISISTLRSQYDLDIQEYSERLRSLNSFLLKAVQNYISALSFGVVDKRDGTFSENEQMAAISRLCALWFGNSEFAAINDLINNSIITNVSPPVQSNPMKKTLPLHSFLPLIYQLAARASFDRAAANPSHFQRTLLRLLVQLTLNFPFDCIYQLLALRSGDSADLDNDTRSKRRKLFDSQGDDSNRKDDADLRAAAASIIIDQSRKVPSLTASISAIEVLVEAYVELANASPPTQGQSPKAPRIDFDRPLKINKLLYPLPTDSALKQIPIPTGPVDGERFSGFINGYRLLGGINLPKQIEVVSGSGSRHCQLVKGKDDVRQDAVMEQVFLRVNRLLSADEETRKRNLLMRTYRVIPLKPLVGLLEWVPDSIPLATFLTEAHERLRPGDLHPSKCRELLKAEAERPGSTVQSKMNVLLKDVGQRFRPVLRYFFFEHFTLKNWWNAKKAYTSSTATASIVGWIVGLGDRHGMNILLDKSTGQVVHIDLNMIFEAGRTLRIPERVPFRLTPDCVDGLGPEGIGLDGPFKTHAIAALKVLRRERSILLMIMDVFKYDPLQKWTGIAKALENNNNNINKSIQNNNNNITTSNNNTLNTINPSNDLITKEADRALTKIKEKLEGREEGVVLSEAGHVAFLIQTAIDPELLCQMYFGWQPYF